ncbi:MAG: hypothetical protein Q9216_001996 [Gyalolechia sp. 2 TL-2023]
MGFFRRLLKGQKRMEGFQGLPPDESKDDHSADYVPSIGPCNTDDLSVASYESGDESDESPADHSQTLSTASTDGKHTYQGLELDLLDFRLLTLNPANNKNDVIHCTLTSTKLRRLPQADSLYEDSSYVGPRYEALSYAWGSAVEKRVIHVNNQPFPVTINLYVALQYLRKTDVTRRLWIDAICINQDDVVEKTHQVGMMRSIYRSASNVLVWLGPSDKDIRKSMGLLERMGVAKTYWPAEKELEPFKPGLTKLFNKSWWFRLWVVQEVLAANNTPLLGCGRAWTSWEVIRRAMSMMTSRCGGDKSVLQGPEAIFGFAIIPRGSRTTRKLDDLLMATSNRNTTLPHDKVFVLLGLATKEAVDNVRVDYGQAYSVIYQRAMVHILQSSSNMNFLIQAMNPRNSREVPSWCVDFSRHHWNSYTTACGWRDDSQDVENKGASYEQPRSMILHDQRRGTIKISGTVVGSIEHVYPWKRENCRLAKRSYLDLTSCLLEPQQRRLQQQNLDIMLKVMIYLTQLARQTLESRLSEGEVLLSLASGQVWKTIGKGRALRPPVFSEQYNSPLPNQYSLIEKFAQQESAEYRSIAAEWSHLGPDFSSQQNQPRISPELLKDLQNWALHIMYEIVSECRDETFITTDSGYIGRAPTAVNAVERGDLLVIIYGCRIPVILRSQGQAYKVVTFSDVTDLMNGEFFNDLKPPTRRFTLR